MEKPFGAPQMRPVDAQMLRVSLRQAWADFLRAPQFGLIFAGFYVLAGWAIAWITVQTERPIGWFLLLSGFR